MAETGTVHSPTAAIASFVSNMSDDSIPANVRDAAKWLILDHLACSIGGYGLSPARIMVDLFEDQGGEPQATVFATGDRTSVLNATYLNSALSNLLDFDDTHTLLAHPGGTVISPAINVGELLGRSGADVLTAVIIGYETMLRLIRAARPTPERYRKVAGLSVWQTLGAVTATSRLLHLAPHQLQHAIGLGLLNAPVPNMRKLGLQAEERPFSWTKNNYGWASKGGVLGALLAERGFLGNRVILDGERGFWIMAGSDQFEPDDVLAGLGEEWLTTDTGFKPYASCRWTHTALDAVRDFQDAHPDIAIEDMTEISLQGYFEVAENLSQPDPTDIIDAQFAVRHVMALEFLGRSSRYGLREDDLDSPEVAELRRRIQVTENPELSRRYLHDGELPVVLTITTRNGDQYTMHNCEPWGNPGRPFSQDEIITKYRALTEPIIGVPASERLMQGVLALDEIESVSAILPSQPRAGAAG